MSDIVRIHREALVPQREIVVARRQEEQNYMLIGVFDRSGPRPRNTTPTRAIWMAVRDWLAGVDLMRVVGARLLSEQQASEPTPSVSAILSPGASSGVSTPTAAGVNDAAGHSQHGAEPAAPHLHPLPITATTDAGREREPQRHHAGDRHRGLGLGGRSGQPRRGPGSFRPCHAMPMPAQAALITAPVSEGPA